MTNHINDVLKEKEAQEAKRRSESSESAAMKLDDTQRVKVLSPGRLVAKRFLRNKLAIIGSAILVLMFLFAFVCPLFYPYGQTEIFYKYDDLIVNYAQATERLDYISYAVNGDIEIHYSIRNRMTSFIKQLEEAGDEVLDITGDDGVSYAVAKLGENVYTLNTNAGAEVAVYSGMDSAATYNTRIKLITVSLPVSDDFENAFTEAVSAGETSFEAGGKTYFIISELRNTYEAIDLSTGTMNYINGDLGSSFKEAFTQGTRTGSFTYNGTDYSITGDVVQGFTVSKAGNMTPVLVSSRFVFDAIDTSTVFSDEFKSNALIALYGDMAFTADGADYTITEEDEGFLVRKDGQAYAIFSTFVVRRYNGEDTLSLDFKAEAENAIIAAIEAGEYTASFIFPLPKMNSEGVYQTDENGNLTSTDTEITATFKVDAWVMTCEQIAHLIDIYGPPSQNHLFGTDSDGFDILARMMYGGRISLMVGFVVVILGCILGVILGGIAGYFGGWVDTLIMRLVDVFYCIPTLPILIILGAFFDDAKMDSYTRLMWMMAVMGFLGWASIARLVRGQILSLREQEFMIAAESMGLRTKRKIFKHLIPNVMPQLIVSATMGLGSVIITEATLSFLGLGVKHPLATWGTMINSITSSNENLIRYAYIWIPVGMLICLTVIAFNFVGDGLRDAFDPKMKQ